MDGWRQEREERGEAEERRGVGRKRTGQSWRLEVGDWAWHPRAKKRRPITDTFFSEVLFWPAFTKILTQAINFNCWQVMISAIPILYILQIRVEGVWQRQKEYPHLQGNHSSEVLTGVTDLYKRPSLSELWLL